MDKQKVAEAARMMLEAMGEDPDREGLRETPRRIAEMYGEILAGRTVDPRVHLKTFDAPDYDEIVVVRDIPFNSICEHHLMPFFGLAHVAYMPSGRVLGISKIARIVETFAHRMQIQEQLTTQVARLLMGQLKPLGVAVVLEATHTCMTIRGVKKPGCAVVTSAMLGTFRENLSSREEVLSLIGIRGRR